MNHSFDCLPFIWLDLRPAWCRTTEAASNVQVDICCGLVGSAFKHDVIGRMAAAQPRTKQLFRLVGVAEVP